MASKPDRSTAWAEIIKTECPDSKKKGGKGEIELQYYTTGKVLAHVLAVWSCGRSSPVT